LTTFDVLPGFEWLLQVVQPLRTLNRVLSSPLRNDPTAVFKRFWLFPIILASLLNILVMLGNHIPAKDPMFFSIYTFIIVLKLFMDVLIIYASLYLTGSRVKINDIIAIYSISVIYLPFVSIAALPLNYNVYAIVMQVNDQHLGQYDSFRYLTTHFKELLSKVQIELGPIPQFLGIIAYVAWLASSILMAEALIQKFKVDDFSSYVSITMANFLGLIPQAFAIVTQVIVMFQFIQPTIVKG
jgi:hypothetical protein